MAAKTRRAEVETAVKGMTVEQVHCRDYGHSWAPHTASRVGRGFDQILRCTRCDSSRHRVLDRSGEVVTNSYRYAEGYLVEGLGRLNGADRGTLRILSVLDLVGP